MPTSDLENPDLETSDLEAIALEIKALVIEALNLEEMTPADIISDAALFGEGLGLDSIDALELGLALQKRYGVALSADSTETRKHFASVTALAAFVASSRTK